MKIGSLFSGSGGFELAATLCGIEPVWAAEIEPYPIAVTRSRFPNMKHLGSVTDIKGDEVEPVDIITFGSPCQDLSVAGKRAGLKHTENGDDETTRSGLFMEAVRIIKEMREATNGRYPDFAIWENVPGAFSSNKGEDFKVVLEELIKIAEPGATVPSPDKGKWPYSDVYMGDGWSLAYRTLDAQYWGVPQRRRRIYLVADFRGQRAGKISFEREGLRGYLAQSGAQREAAAGDAESGIGTADCGGMPYTLKIRSGCEGGGKGALVQMGMSATLATNNDQYLFQPILDDQGGSQISVRTDGKAPTLRAEMHGNVPCVMEESKTYDARGNGDGRTASTITGDHENRITDYTSVVVEPVVYNGENITSPLNRTNPQPGDPCHTLGTDSRNYLVYCLQGNGIDRADTAGCNGRGWNDETCYTLNTIDRPAVAYGIETFHCTSEEEKVPTLKARDWKDPHVVAYWDGGQTAGTLTANNAGGNQRMPDKDNFNCVVECHPKPIIRYIVRRLTPTECARLQGFPDKWGHPDTKNKLTDEEYAFWLDVRNTHAAINGKVVKDYTKAQMLTWYNKLHTDSSEYKMWGNGIALPCALYVMQGIAEVSNEN